MTGDNQQVTVPAGTVELLQLIDVYEYDPGSLFLTKTITGPAAGQQGPIAILVSCGGPEDFACTIPAGTAAGSVSDGFDNTPAGSVCTVTETSTGRTATLTVSTVGSPQQVTIPASGLVTADLTDSYATLAVAPTPTLAATGPGRGSGLLADLAAGATLGGVIIVIVGTRTRRRHRTEGPPKG